MSYFQARLAEVQIPPKKPQKYLFHVPRTRIKGIAFAIPFIFLLIRQQGIRTRTVGFADENSPVDCLKVRG